MIKISLKTKNSESTCSSIQSTSHSNSTQNPEQIISLFVFNVRSFAPKIDDVVRVYLEVE